MKKIILLLSLSVVMLFAGCGKPTETAEQAVSEIVTETESVTEAETTVETTAETTTKVTETTVQTTVKKAETTVAVSETVQNAVQPATDEEAPVISEEEPQQDTASGEDKSSITGAVIDGVDIYSGEQYSYGDNNEEQQQANEEPAYDPVLHELGIDIVLTGTPAEQAIQYGEALSSVFPGHINYGDASCAPTCDVNKVIEYTNLPDGSKSLYDEWLAGRNWQDLSDQELFDHLELAAANNSDIGKYLADKYSRTFAETTGMHILY